MIELVLNVEKYSHFHFQNKRILFTFVKRGSIVPNKGIGFGPGIPRDSQYPKFHV